MTTANFIDVHVLGDPAHVRLGMKAIHAFLDKEEGSVVDKPGRLRRATAPWPATGAHQAMGAVFDGSSVSLPLSCFREIAKEGLSAAPGVFVVLVHWDLDNTAVRMRVSSLHANGKVTSVTSVETDPGSLEAGLGQEWSDALFDDDVVGRVGELMLPMLLAKANIKKALAPLAARAKHDRMEAILPQASPVAKPRF